MGKILQPPVVTGYGAITALGGNCQAAFRNMADGLICNVVMGGIFFPKGFTAPCFQVPSVAPDVGRSKLDDRIGTAIINNRTILLTLLAVAEGLHRAGLSLDELQGKRVGVVLGTTVGCTFHNEEYYIKWRDGHNPTPEPLLAYLSSNLADKVKELLEERINAYSMQDYFGEVLIPTEDVEEIIRGTKGKKKTKTTSRKFFPGYILIQMEMSNETWHFVKDTPKVTGFIGSKTQAIAIPDDGIDELRSKIEEGTLRPAFKTNYEKGDEVIIMDGPFSNFNGVIEEINEEKRKLKVMVKIFGRKTPLELSYMQVEKDN